jgi:two-component system, sensor histidine kinase and response regulator
VNEMPIGFPVYPALASTPQTAFASEQADFHKLAESLPQIVWITDADGKNIFFNQKWVEYTGLPLAESLGDGWNKPFHPDDRQRAWGAWQNAVTNNDTYSLECRLRRADGAYRWWLVRGAPQINESGVIEQWFGTCTDIHDAVLAKAEAEKANRAKTNFLAAASHDLRQPVQSLTLLLSVIERQVTENPKAADLVGMAKSTMESLNGMLSGILEISRLDAGVISPVIACVDVGELIDKLAREYHHRAADCRLELRCAPLSLRVSTDVTLLERMLRNLIENALRYTERGGVLVGVRRRGQRVSIEVIDTGIGIPENRQDEIFEEFRQLGNPARDSRRGLGLGLSIVSRLGTLLDIEVQVKSTVGRGTRFSLLLPLVDDEPVKPLVKLETQDVGGRILIIEDNFNLRQIYEIMLKDWGYETLGAASGEEALKLATAEDWRLDAIVADHRLGCGLTGDAAATEIARHACRSFPTMLLTGDTDRRRLIEAAAGGFILLHKPVEADDLRRALGSLLRGDGGASSR